MTEQSALLPLDYPSFTRFIQEQDNGRLLVAAESQRRAKLLTMFQQGHLLIPAAPGSISVAFSPRPLESADLLDDLRCLIRSVEALERENKRLQSRCAYLSTINDLLGKANKRIGSSMSLSAIQPRIQVFTEFSHNEDAKVPTSPPPVTPTTESSPATSPPTHMYPGFLAKPQSGQQTVTFSHDYGKHDSSSNKLTSFGKMIKASTKFLSKPKKMAGTTKSVRKMEMVAIEASSSGSNLTDPSSLTRSKSVFSKHRNVPVETDPVKKSTGDDDTIVVKRRKSKEQNSVGNKSEDEMDTDLGSPELDHLYMKSVAADTDSSYGGVVDSIMLTSCDSIEPAGQKPKSAKRNNHHTPLFNDGLDKTRVRAWTWDVSSRKPWNRLKNMLRRASAPHYAGRFADSRSSSSSIHSKRGYAQGAINREYRMGPARQKLSKHLRAESLQQDGPQFQTNSTGSIDSHSKRKLRIPETSSLELARSIHLLALATSNELTEQQEQQRNSISKMLNLLKIEDESEAKVDEMEKEFFEVLIEHSKVNPLVVRIIDILWKDLRTSCSSSRALRRTYLSDRLKLIEWANAHCHRLLVVDHKGECRRSSSAKRRSFHSPSLSENVENFSGSQSPGRYNDSTGLYYGNKSSSGENIAKFKPKRISRRWYTFGAADAISKSQGDVSRHLAASICSLFSSLGALNSQEDSIDPATRFERLINLVKKVKVEPGKVDKNVETDPPPSPPLHYELIKQQSLDIASSQGQEESFENPQFATSISNSTDLLPNVSNIARKSQPHILSADELIQSVARSRSSSVIDGGLASPAILPTPVDAKPSPGKRSSIAVMSTSTEKRNPSLTAITIALEFAKAARQRAQSVGEQARLRLKPVHEPDISSIAVTSPSTSEKDAEFLERKDSSRSPSLPPASPISMNSMHMNEASATKASQSLSQIPMLPVVHRIAPSITVSPSQLPTSGRSRFKSLVELSTATPITKIFASSKLHQAKTGKVKSAPCSTRESKTAITSTPTSSFTASSPSSRTTVIAHLSPPPILSAESEYTVSSSPELKTESTPPASSVVEAAPISTATVTNPPVETMTSDTPQRKHFNWFTRFWKKSPKPIKRFSSCGVGPADVRVGEKEVTPTGFVPVSLSSLSAKPIRHSDASSSLRKFLKGSSKHK